MFKLIKNLNSRNHFENEAKLIKKFLSLEKESDRKLTWIHESTNYGTHFNSSCFPIKFKQSNNLLQISERTRDPVVNSFQFYSQSCSYFVSLQSFFSCFKMTFKSANFLDENFTAFKINRIKYLADLYKQIARLDHHKKGEAHKLDGLGVHLIDNELREKF